MSYIFFLFLASAFCASHIKASSTAELGKVNTTETAVLAETAKVGCVVIFLSFVLLILIDPLPDTILAQIQPTKSLGKEGEQTLSKSVLTKCTFLASFNKRGQYSNPSFFFRRTISTPRGLWCTLLLSTSISA